MNCANEPIITRAEFMARHLNKHNIRSATLLVLYDLRIPINYDGFDYLLNAIPEAFACETQIVAGEIYDIVGSQYTPKVESRNMDSAIRDAIKAAWKNKAEANWNCYFPEYIINRKKPPSNLEFIVAIVYFLELWQDCCPKEASYAIV